MAHAARNWSFTINNPTEDEITILDGIEVNFIIYQIEQGTNNTPHIQGFVQLKTKLRMAGVKRLLCPRGHYEQSRGSPDSNIAYCSKEPRLRGPFRRGICQRPGQRNDLLSFTESIKKGANDAQLIENHLNEFYKFSRTIDRVRLAYRAPRDWEMDVRVYWGRSGSGKTRRAYQEAGDSVYFVSKGDTNQTTWWDGYNGQSSVILDDFYGKLT